MAWITIEYFCRKNVHDVWGQVSYLLEPKAMTDVYITQQCLVRWQSVSVNQPLKVLLVRYAPNYKVYQTLAQNLGPSTTTFKWIVGHIYTPGDATIWPVPGDGFKIRVETIDGKVYGESGYIGIFDPLLTVTAPTGQTYHLNDTMIICWNYNNWGRGSGILFMCLRWPGGLFSRKPHCVGEHLQCQDGVRRFKRCIVSMDIP